MVTNTVDTKGPYGIDAPQLNDILEKWSATQHDHFTASAWLQIWAFFNKLEQFQGKGCLLIGVGCVL